MDVSGEGFSGDIHGYMPVQGFGVVGSYRWYFRARWNWWSLEVFPRELTTICADDEDIAWMAAGDYDNASHMEHDVAKRIVDDYLSYFLAQRGLS
jgi:hypothetical protein